MFFTVYLYTRMYQESYPYGKDNGSFKLVSKMFILETKNKDFKLAIAELKKQFYVEIDAPAERSRSAKVIAPNLVWNIIPSRGFITLPNGAKDNILFTKTAIYKEEKPSLQITPFEFFCHPTPTSVIRELNLEEDFQYIKVL